MCQDATKYNTHVNASWFDEIFSAWVHSATHARVSSIIFEIIFRRVFEKCSILKLLSFKNLDFCENLIWVKISWNDIYIHSLSIQVYSWMYMCIYIVDDSYLPLCANKRKKMSCDTNVRWRHLRGWFMLD